MSHKAPLTPHQANQTRIPRVLSLSKDISDDASVQENAQEGPCILGRHWSLQVDLFELFYNETKFDTGIESIPKDVLR
jgi:hypothetical protein